MKRVLLSTAQELKKANSIITGHGKNKNYNNVLSLQGIMDAINPQWTEFYNYRRK
jgi:hypothetical protein